MQKIINKFISSYIEKNKKRFDLTTLEKNIISAYGGESQYYQKGGYKELYNQIQLLKEKQQIKEIESSLFNGLNPPLKSRWQIIVENDTPQWDKSKILKYSDLLDLTYYINHPAQQTELEWEYIENIYKFLKSREEREWASVEERSLELFYDEKFLINRKETTKGKYGICNRLKITYHDLKIKKYGEMFIYWNRGTENIKNIIILENHSTFFSYKRIAEGRQKVLGVKPDILIYGEGKKVESSIAFLKEITNTENVEIFYFGDIDSEGFGIYYRLKEKYSEMNIQLHQEAYKHLLSICKRDYPLGGQQKNQKYLDYFIEEMKPYLEEEEINKLISIWNREYRVPQELINYEYLLKVIR